MSTERKAISVRLMAGITLMGVFLVTLLWMTLVSAHGATHPRT